jgi:hypothetical protein
MATLYLENIPDDIYQALRERARSQRKSMAQVVIGLLEQHVPTAAEVERRRRFLRKALRGVTQRPPSPGPFPSAEEMIREDRVR